MNEIKEFIYVSKAINKRTCHMVKKLRVCAKVLCRNFNFLTPRISEIPGNGLLCLKFTTRLKNSVIHKVIRGVGGCASGLKK